MFDWFGQNSGALFSALIGVFGALLGVTITLIVEGHRRKTEEKAKAKPIVINYSLGHVMKKEEGFPNYIFESEGDCEATITGVFKNTDNGILFIDFIDTENKRYCSKHPVVVDKNTIFHITLSGVNGDSLKKLMIHCHDIYDTPYIYNASFVSKIGTGSQIVIRDCLPVKKKKIGRC